MIINIIGGNGVMGKIHKTVFENFGHQVIISGRNSNPSMEQAAKKSDLTIISVPIDATLNIIEKIAPHCKAIMDFTSLKEFPVEAMLKYSNRNCEVAGLHPLYGEVENIKGRTVVLCKTSRTDKLCSEIVDCLAKSGANIVELTPEEHDKKVVSLNQVLRLKIIAAYIETIKNCGISIKDFYNISSPPTKIILELMARQINEKNDSMYDEMIENDKFSKEIEKEFLDNVENVKNDYMNISKDMRNSFGPEFLKELQEKAKKKID